MGDDFRQALAPFRAERLKARQHVRGGRRDREPAFVQVGAPEHILHVEPVRMPDFVPVDDA